MNLFDSIRIQASPLVKPVQTLKVSPNCPCSDEMRAEMDKYLLDMFGMQDCAYLMDFSMAGLGFGHQVFVMNPEYVAMLKMLPGASK